MRRLALLSFITLSVSAGARLAVAQDTTATVRRPEIRSPQAAGPIEGAVDRATYRLGPGDRVAVTMRGVTPRSVETNVSAEGTLVLQPGVSARVAGLTIDEAQSALRDALASFFQGVDVRLDLLQVRQFEVYVLGEVRSPGTYVAHGATRVSTIVEMAEGISENGSQRTIRIERSDGSVLRADLLSFLVLGKREANPFLSDGDRIMVPFSGERAVIGGSVARPDDYEVLADETITEIIQLAGGTTPGADRSRVEIRRFLTLSDPETERISVNLDDSSAVIKAQPGDQIFVYPIPDWHLRRQVEIVGEVLYPGSYVIDEGRETLTGVIARAGGFAPAAAISEVTLTRSIGKETIDPEFERLKKIEVSDMTEDEYEYFKLRSREHPGRVVVDVGRLFLEGDQTEDVLLRRGDILSVPLATQSVKVSGQVASPGAVKFEAGKPVRWYIDEAGGYGWRAEKGETRVIRARTGEWIPGNRAKVVEVGDTIWVPEKPERDYWELFRDYLVVVGQIATIYLVVDSIAE